MLYNLLEKTSGLIEYPSLIILTIPVLEENLKTSLTEILPYPPFLESLTVLP